MLVHPFWHNLSAQATESQLLAAGHHLGSAPSEAAQSLPSTSSQGVMTPAQSVPETPAETVAASPQENGSVPSTPVGEVHVKPMETKPSEKNDKALNGQVVSISFETF